MSLPLSTRSLSLQHRAPVPQHERRTLRARHSLPLCERAGRRPALRPPPPALVSVRAELGREEFLSRATRGSWALGSSSPCQRSDLHLASALVHDLCSDLHFSALKFNWGTSNVAEPPSYLRSLCPLSLALPLASPCPRVLYLFSPGSVDRLL
jgi:hypothetical protein